MMYLLSIFKKRASHGACDPRAQTPKRVSGMPSERGFSLVVCVAMLVLLTLIAVGLLSLSTITVRETSQNQARKEAMANARMALMVAISELQHHMGPDQRISMTADQRMSPGGDGSTSSVAAGNRHWTGIYNAWAATEEDRPDPSSAFRSWLVSGASSLTAREDLPDSALSESNSIELVSEGTVGSGNPLQHVRVPMVEVDAGPGQGGRMAWWVGDQGVKAALSTPPAASGSTLALARNNLASAPRNAHELVALDDATKPFEAVDPTDARLSRMLSWQQAAFLSTSPEQPGALFHDMSAHSSGLLTNVRRGGFRKDLSMKMEYHTEAPDLTDTDNVLYTVRSNVTGNDEVGINFMELWAYYHLYKQLQFDGGLTYTTGGGIPAAAPYLETKASIEGPDGIVQDNWDMYKHPLVINYEMLLSFEVYPYDIIGHRTTTNPVLDRSGNPVFDNNGNQLFNDQVFVERTINGLFVNHDTIITLWNPLDVAVHIKSFRPSQSVGTHPRNNCYLFFFPRLPYDAELRKNDGTRITCPLDRVTQSSICMDVGRVERADRDDPIILKPGEVVMFAQAGSNNNSLSGRIEVPYYGAGFSSLRLFAGKGFNFGGGMSAVARDNNFTNLVYQAGVRPNRNTGEIRPRSTNAGTPIELDPGESFSYSLTPSNDRQGGGSGGGSMLGWSYMIGNPWGRHMRGLSIYGMATIDHDWGYDRAQVGEETLDRWRVRNPFNLTPLDDGVSDLFPTFDDPSTTQQLSHGRLAANKVPFMSISLKAKTEMDGQRGTKALARLNPKAHFLNFWDLSPKERDMLPYELRIRPVTSFLDSGLAEVMPNGRAYFGAGMDGAFGSGFVTTHSVPRQPLISMASFQNSFANGFNRLAASGQTGYPERGQTSERHSRLARRPLLPQISHAIGNSLAPSVLASDQIKHEPGSGDSNPHPLADHSYLANRELWDDYFLSGIAPQPTPAFSSARDQETVALEFFRDGNALPVARYLPDTGGQDPTDLARSLFSGGTPTEESINLVASHLRVDGMFNVNSTSVEAWKAMLGSLKGRPIVVRSEDGQESIATVDDIPVAGITAPSDTVLQDVDASAPDRNSHWDGRRELTEEEVDRLARAIVMEVRKRGPFLNLGDFINRRVGDDVELARAGAIQTALDADDTGINTAQNAGRDVAPAVAGRFAFPEAEEGAIHYGAPSLVKQGDILTPIAPVLSARSDSFIIRAYGESLDNSGQVVAKAWCEAVVERTRDYVDPADDSEVLPADLTSVANQTFGRQFKMVSFRWLNPTEI